jgi:protein TonB
MFATRVPFAVVAGGLFSAAIFLTLAQLVSLPFSAQPSEEAFRIEFTPQRKDTPIENKRDPKVTRTQPPVVPGVAGPSKPGVEVTLTKHVVPVIEVEAPTGGGLPVGTDRDVLPLVRVPPEYPPSEAARGIEGWVQVRFSVTATGSVRDAVVVASEPGTTFDDAALKAIARWRYNPRVDAGVAVERVGLETVFRFELEN